MKKKKITDQITFRAEEWQLKRLEEIEAMSPKDLKKSAVVRAALRHYFASNDSVLPSGYGKVNPDTPDLHELPAPEPKKRPIRLKGSPEIQKPRKNDSGAASA